MLVVVGGLSMLLSNLSVHLRCLLRPAGLLAVLATGFLLGCANPEMEAVRTYKDFLERAKPSLLAMNQARQDLYDLNEPEKMPTLFKDKLLPQVEQFSALADKEPALPGKLGTVHEGLKSALKNYAGATRQLVDKLKSTNDDEREKALLAWGQDDQRFGKQMESLVEDLSKHLDELRR